MNWILFFDGDCGLCNRSVRRIARWDKAGKIRFASLQGEFAKRHQVSHHLDAERQSMVLLEVESGRKLTESDAGLQILRLLGGAWKLLLPFGWLPRRWRDGLYQCVVRNRHRLGGSADEHCVLADPNLEGRLLD
ncbi:MAG: DCC1-like thiol-disulfide oxidoreductase family protein [Akkermansiaceae bacterium]|nr:DCC1-like thiol-disulfide oxidoreductase family protein [Akkermansiaceae bacterium]